MHSPFSTNFQPIPYWHDGVKMPRTSAGKPPKSVDICIIGAGYTGLTIGLELLRAGKSVAIFDAMKLGHGASGKNGGMIGPSLHKLGLTGLTKIYGQAKAHDILQEGIHAIEYFKKFIEQENIDCDLAMTGRFRGVNNQQDLDNLASECETLSKLIGFQYKVVSHQDIHTEIGSDHYHSGVVYGLDGGLHPQKLVAALAKKILDLGGYIFEQSRVTNISQTKLIHHVETAKGNLQAGELVMATNGYTKKFSTGAQKPKFSAFYNKLLPITSAMIATETLPEAVINKLFPKRRMHGGNHRLVQYYRPSPDGKRVLFGARGVDFFDRANINGKNLKSLLDKIFPELQPIKIDYSWSGKVAYTFDHVPHIGKQDGIYYAMGYCGSGVTRSVYLGKKLSMQILGQEDSQTSFDDLNFQSKPFYNGSPWFLPIVLKWHGFLDRRG